MEATSRMDIISEIFFIKDIVPHVLLNIQITKQKDEKITQLQYLVEI